MSFFNNLFHDYADYVFQKGRIWLLFHENFGNMIVRWNACDLYHDFYLIYQRIFLNLRFTITTHTILYKAICHFDITNIYLTNATKCIYVQRLNLTIYKNVIEFSSTSWCRCNFLSHDFFAFPIVNKDTWNHFADYSSPVKIFSEWIRVKIPKNISM